MRFLVAGLGNPGRKYARTRHNVGALVLKRLYDLVAPTATARTAWEAETRHGSLASLTLDVGDPPVEAHVTFFLPDIEMNNNGGMVLRQLRRLPADTIPIILHDEVDLKVGEVKKKWSGSANGNKGVASVKTCLNTYDFWRIRLGIDRPESRKPHIVADYVLQKPRPDEMLVIEREYAEMSRRELQTIIAINREDSKREAAAVKKLSQVPFAERKSKQDKT